MSKYKTLLIPIILLQTILRHIIYIVNYSMSNVLYCYYNLKISSHNYVKKREEIYFLPLIFIQFSI